MGKGEANIKTFPKNFFTGPPVWPGSRPFYSPSPAGAARSARRLLPFLALLVGVTGALVVWQNVSALEAARADLVLLGLGAIGGAVVVHEYNRSGRDGLQQLG